MNRTGSSVLLACLVGCGQAAVPLDATVPEDASPDAPRDASETDGPVADASAGAFATRVVSYDAGPGAGFGQSRLPGVVLGPPIGGGDSMGSTDVVSLGAGGTICLAFDPLELVDGAGDDFIVFENAFLRAGSTSVFDELGEVSVSDDGITFHPFACDPTAGPPAWPGCAGWHPVYSTPANGIAPADPAVAGGDAFDLADVGLARASIVCVRDLGTQPASPPSTGFDLDAIAAIHAAPSR